VQHLEMEQEYGDFNVGGGGRGASGSRNSVPNQNNYPMHPQQQMPNYPSSQPPHNSPGEWGYVDQSQVYQSLPATQYSPQPYYPTSSTSNGLPPGAMRPAQVEHSWASGYSQSVVPEPPHSAPPHHRGYSRSTSPSPPNNRSRSPSSDGERTLRKSPPPSRSPAERQSSPGAYSRSASVGGSQPTSNRSSASPSGKLGGRSLSATAVMVNTSNHFNQQEDGHRSSGGQKLKKRPSAGSPISRPPPQMQQRYDGVEEEEDMPLAVVQEQHQRSRRR